MQRRAFLQLLAATPIAALAPWRPPAPGFDLVVDYRALRAPGKTMLLLHYIECQRRAIAEAFGDAYCWSRQRGCGCPVGECRAVCASTQV